MDKKCPRLSKLMIAERLYDYNKLITLRKWVLQEMKLDLDHQEILLQIKKERESKNYGISSYIPMIGISDEDTVKWDKDRDAKIMKENLRHALKERALIAKFPLTNKKSADENVG